MILIHNIYDKTIKGVTIDSRAIKTNMLFIPFKGENVDGHRFVSQALKDGAGLLSMKRAMTLMITWRTYYMGRRYINCVTTIS